jgi:hypothetical protein
LSHRHQAASAQIAVIDPAQDLKAFISMETSRVVSGDKAAGIDICQVYDVESA